MCPKVWIPVEIFWRDQKLNPSYVSWTRRHMDVFDGKLDNDGWCEDWDKEYIK